MRISVLSIEDNYCELYSRREMTMKRQFFIYISLLLILFLFSCSKFVEGIPPDEPEQKEGETVIITPAAVGGNSANLKVGDQLEIHIPTIPMEGFHWEIQEFDDTILRQEGNPVYVQDPDPNSAGGNVIIKFTAIDQGETNIHLLYVQPETDSNPSLSSASFGMLVEVSPNGN